MDVNTNVEVKAFGVPAIPPMEKEAHEKPQVRPIEEGNGAGVALLDDRVLKGKERQGPVAQGDQPSPEEARVHLKNLNKLIGPLGTKLAFELNDETGTMIVQVRNRETDKIIRQFPPEEMLQLEAKIKELVGLLFDKEA